MNDKGRIFRSFALGFILGGALVFTGMHFARHHWRGDDGSGMRRDFSPKRLLEKLSRELKLDPGQKTQVEKILDANLPKMKEMRDKMKPQMDALRLSLQSQIRAVLRPDQQVLFDKRVGEFEKRRMEREDRMDAK